MVEPLNLVERYGEGWCVTLARRPLPEALAAMGVEPARQEEVPPPNGEGELADPPPVLAARALEDGWTLVVETSGMEGWVGERDEVLEELTKGGASALSLVLDTSTDLVLYAEDGAVLLRFEPSTAESEGEAAERFEERLAGAGFFLDGDDRLPPDLEALPGGQLSVYAAELVWGRPFTAGMFDGPDAWRGGVSRL